MLRTAAALSAYPLVTNQRYHPFSRSTAVLATSRCRTVQSDGIIAGWRRPRLQVRLIGTIAARHQRSIAQVVLRWLVQQQRVLALSRTETIERIRPNKSGSSTFPWRTTRWQTSPHFTLREAGIVNPSHLAARLGLRESAHKVAWRDFRSAIVEMPEGAAFHRRPPLCRVRMPLGAPRPAS